MSEVTYPGVYIREAPSGVRTITGVATSITAFVGSASRGLTNSPVRVQSFAEYQTAFGDLSRDHPMSYAVNHFFLNGGGDALIVRVSNGTAATGQVGTGANALGLAAASGGEWGNSLQVEVTHPNPQLNANAAAQQLFNLLVTDNGSGAVEAINNVSVLPGHARFVTNVLRDTSKLIRVRGNVAGTRPAASNSGAFTTGTNGANITNNSISAPNLQAQKRGLWALEDADLFNLLCIPPLSLDVASDDINAQTRTAAHQYCVARRAMFIADPRFIWDEPADFTHQTQGLGGGAWGLTAATNAALYFPYVRMPDPAQEGRLADFAPCGVIAGTIARTDANRGVWKAPAGLDAQLRGVSELKVKLTDGQNGILNPLGVNCLRAFNINGRVAWGSRTLAGADALASEWKYLPVRRTALFIEESLYRGTQWVVFEPNDEGLWAQIRLNVGAFMQDLFKRGAFQGASAGDAYFVACDAETTTQNDINNGIVNIRVGFAPLKPAEFVVITLQQMAGQVQV